MLNIAISGNGDTYVSLILYWFIPIIIIFVLMSVFFMADKLSTRLTIIAMLVSFYYYPYFGLGFFMSVTFICVLAAVKRLMKEPVCSPLKTLLFLIEGK